MIKAVIFDCFGVLTTDGWRQIREEFFASDKTLMQHSLDIDKAVNAGMMSYDAFITEISAMSGLSATEVRRRLNGAAPNSQLFDFIRDELKGAYKIGMLSNAADNWLNELFEPSQVALFDATVLSYETGRVKPDPEIYAIALERLGVEAREAIFVDDSERYCTSAADLGIHAIWHQNTSDTIDKIREMINARTT